MSDADDQGEIDMTIESEVADLDGDGVVDTVTETTSTTIDLDGDGVVDIIQQTRTTAIDVDGDGVADIVETTTATGFDADGDGEISDDEFAVETELAVREDLVSDDGS